MKTKCFSRTLSTIIICLSVLFTGKLLLLTFYVFFGSHKPSELILGSWIQWPVTVVGNVELASEIWDYVHSREPMPVFLNNTKTKKGNHESVLSSRVQKMFQVCDYYKMNNLGYLWETETVAGHNYPGSGVFVDETRHELFCLIPKVGCSSFKKYFLSRMGLDPKVKDLAWGFHESANHLLRAQPSSYYAKSEITKRTSLRIIFTRHPFRRLVSAFVDKLLGPNNRDGFYSAYSIPIMRRYRGSSFNFNNHTLITFEEFVNYLIETPPIYYNSHWVPYWMRCEPCKIKYNFVGALETFNSDTQFAFGAKVKIYKPRYGESLSLKRALKYFGELPLEKRLKLYEVFRLDFEMFGYTIEEYL